MIVHFFKWNVRLLLVICVYPYADCVVDEGAFHPQWKFQQKEPDS